jgi:predicted transcriptional regulator of viral defense system
MSRKRATNREAAIARVARDQHGLITIRQLLALGFDEAAIRYRVRAGRLHRVRRGVYAVGHTALTVSGRRLAAVLALGDLALASHITAAAIWGLRQTASGLIHVTVPGTARDRAGIRVHRRVLTDADRARHEAIPVTSLARTLVDLGDVVPPVQVRNAFVRAEQLRLIDMQAIDDALARAGRFRGSATLREVLRVHDPRWERTRSNLELAFLDLASAFALPRPEVNAWIEDAFLVDALWRPQRVIVEVDSRRFHDTPTGRRDDARRDHDLQALGYRVLRVRDEEIERRSPVAATQIARLLAGS